QLVFYDRHSGVVIGMVQFRRKPPFETGKQTLLNINHIHRSLVTGQDYLFAVLVQVVENMEENILCAGLSGKQLDVINDQYVYYLIEVDKIIAVVLFN